MLPLIFITTPNDLISNPIDVTNFIGDKASGASYEIAHFVMSVVDRLLSWFSLEHNLGVVTFFYTVVVLAIAVVVGYIAQFIVFHATRFIARKWDSAVSEALMRQRVLIKICRLLPPVVFLILLRFTLSHHDALTDVFTKITLVIMNILIAIAVNAFITAMWQLFDTHKNKRKFPLRGLCELLKGIVRIITAVITICILFNKSPAALLTGLGAFAAVLMLIFKDSILGVVAGVQLSQNDTLHVGDWIKVDSAGANGTVTEVTLTSVKVLNWDKTTTTLPPYSLISGSFTNYRSMQKSNTRRIQRSFMIDADSVLPATPQMLDDIRKVPFMDAYISKKLEQRAAGTEADVNNPAGLVNGTIDTNLGLFRAYFKMWLDANPHISHDNDCFVSTLPQTATGIPFQVYCFTNTSAWLAYEAIQDSVFEQLAAMLRFFRLYTFENPSGRDTIIDGYLSTGHNISDIYGIPYPFYQSPDGRRTHLQDSRHSSSPQTNNPNFAQSQNNA